MMLPAKPCATKTKGQGGITLSQGSWWKTGMYREERQPGHMEYKEYEDGGPVAIGFSSAHEVYL